MAVRLLPSFVDDVEEAYSFLRERSPQAASTLVEQTELLLGLLSEFPAMGRERRDLRRGLHSMRVRGFPYVVFYRIEGRDVVMVRLLHGARRLRRGLFVE